MLTKLKHMELLHSSYFAFFTIVTFGFLLGRIKIKGISLDISAVIFVALVFGHFGILIPKDFQNIGLVLFIFTIGIQAGPGFFQSFKTQGKKLIVMATTLIISAGLCTFAVVKLFHLDMNAGIGLLTGALTSTPGLAAAIETTGSPLASISYGVAYPFGVIGVILFVSLYPRIFKMDLQKASKDYTASERSGYATINTRNFIVDNPEILGKSIKDLRVRYMTGGVISRIMKNKEAFTPTANTILEKGYIVKAVGSEEALKRVQMLIGSETKQAIPFGDKYDVRRVLVTKNLVVNKTLKELNVLENYGATITNIRRTGVDIVPGPNDRIQFGDKLTITCRVDNLKQIVNAFGNDKRRLSNTDFLPICLGILIGVLLGKLTFSLGGFNFSLGLTGGVLFSGLLLGRIGKTGSILWTMTGSSNNLLRQLGLLFFLSAVGTSAGSRLVDTYNESGAILFVAGGIITLVPMIVATVVARLAFKMNPLTMLGALTGSMTSTPGLAATDSLTDTNAPSVAYATVYPIAMVLLIIVVKILAIIG